MIAIAVNININVKVLFYITQIFFNTHTNFKTCKKVKVQSHYPQLSLLKFNLTMGRVSKKPIKPFGQERQRAPRQGNTYHKALVAPSFAQFLSLLSFWQFSR